MTSHEASTAPTEPAGPANRATLISRGAVIVTAMMFGLTYSLSAALIALDLAARDLADAFHHRGVGALTDQKTLRLIGQPGSGAGQ